MGWLRTLCRCATALVFAGALAGCGRREKAAENPEGDRAAEVVRQLVASEELIIELAPRLKKFAGELRAGRRDRAVAELGVELSEWAGAAQEETVAREEFGPRLLAGAPEVARWMDASLALVRGQFDAASHATFNTMVTFEGSGTAADGRIVAGQGEQEVRWEKAGEAGWQITSWRMTKFATTASKARLFEEVLDRAIPNAGQLQAARESMHGRILIESYFGGKPASLPAGYSDSRFFPDSINVHPAVSVVDVDGDGWDDLYVCVRWGKNLLLRNRGDGSFEECAARFGLDIDGRNTSATFADFDNDGDQDLMLGRSLERSLYLENIEGRFERRPEAAGSPGLPWLVTSTSAADYNGDGLLDVYFCTYSPLDINTRITGDAAGQAPEWAQRFLPAAQAEEVVRRSRAAHSYLGQVGPPNVLFVNRGGGRFEVAPESEALAGWRNSFQAAWSDYDRDGDPDLYVANDFSPDLFYRNDGAQGFSDVTAEAGVQSMGFAMGASWGDYDNDGREDLYVSNMYSKAGRRITSQVAGLDPRISASAEGNYLFRHEGGTSFRRVSGESGEALRVTKAGWSWGGQFADFDNDGYLDLYVSSGFYTPPAEVDIGVDL